MRKRFRIITTLCMAMAAFLAASAISGVAGPADETEDIPLFAGRIQIDALNTDREGEPIYREPGEKDKLVASNSGFELYLDYEDFAVKIRNKTTGYLWESIVGDEQAKDVPKSWRNFSQSLIAGDFITVSSGYAKTRVTLLDKEGAVPEITLIDNGFKAAITFPDVEVSCELVITLTEKGFNARVPYESIRQGKIYALSALYILPMFGAVLEDSIPGYVVIPDGSGALIRFEKVLNYESPYTARIYGKDLGVKEYTLKTDFATLPTVEDEPATMPIFGMAHGSRREAYLAVIQDGDLSCDIIASAAGTELAYSRACARFIYRETFWQPTGGEAGFYLIQTDANSIEAKVDYTLLSGDAADYTGMAREYAEQLAERGVIPASAGTSGNIPIKLDIIIAEQAEGFFGSKIKVLTELKDISTWVSDFSGSAVDNIIYSLIGFENGGISGHTIGDFRIEKKAGSESEMKKLAEKILADGDRLIFQTDLTTGYPHQLSKKNIKLRESGQYAMTLDTSLLFQEKLYLNDSTVDSLIGKLAGLPEYMDMFALDTIAMNLTSNYRKRSAASRLATYGNVMGSLAKAREAAGFLMIEEPNVYAAGFADGIYNIPLTHSKLMFERDAVPFIQTVYSGRTECYSNNLNFAGDDRIPLLKLIEFNTYPSYVLSAAQSSEFAETNSNHVYSSKYEDWRSDIRSGYEFINQYLSEVRGCTIVSRDVPESGVSVTEYSNGVSIAVNFTEEPYVYQGTLIEAGSAEIIRQGT
ncbi:MAG: DUF5696 domain-containing protein [Saccharofermentanales bacterium]